ncbi:MAG: endonuclease/exonuclease/phosphatase (EEP) superfamily protein YafD [Francisella sp.]|jgi:endonuclease/exonuclease/phosphatase (EEP) superfamily protein YafD
MVTDKSLKYLSIMSWNTYKVDHKKPLVFAEYIKETYSKFEIDIFCLQEAVHHSQSCFPIENFSVNFASNIVLKSRNYGVATVTNMPISKSIKILTTHKESVINTHKSSLISHIDFHGQEVVVVNIHAINFKSNRVYEYEFKKIKEFISLDKYHHPIIIAGDFNSWNRKRVKLIKDFCREFNFKIAYIDEPSLIKSFQNNHLDFILYRGLSLESACVLDCKKISDHNPIIAKFKPLI